MAFAIFFAHEQQRDIGRQQNGGGGQFQLFEREVGRQPVSQGAIADLVMILSEDDELIVGIAVDICAERTLPV
jgi:hypothetical protein